MKRFIFVIAALFAALSVSAQQMPPIPVDPAVRIGHLDNGLTYYIRHNAEPAGQANFYIAQKVGSILEEEEQRGLAHFLEHMCFNGTEHFPGNAVIQYCESIGVKFGADLNAYTSIDETVYNIDNVPVGTTPSAIDTCLWILRDWAGGLLLLDEDIDHERGVIREEWRSRRNATIRMYDVILPELYAGNRYGERMPIGLLDVINNFPYQAIRDYYHKWYRPDQQGIVVVGDIDVDAVEAKIRSIFSTLTMPENAAERYYIPIEDNEAPLISIATDKEQPYAMSYIMVKHEAVSPEQKGDLNYFVYDYAINMIARMYGERLYELSQAAEPPFIQASVEDGDYMVSKTKGALTGAVISGAEDFLKGVTTVYREMLRAVRGGFTASEYERAKANYLSSIESAYNMREKKKSAEYCSEYVRHFIDNEPIPGIENEFALAQQLAPNIPVETINTVLASLFGKGNLAVACMLPDKEGVTYPTREELAAALAAVEAEDIEPYVEETSDEPLVSELPAPGKVVKTAAGPFGYTKYTLSNGATVYFRSTDFNADQVRMSGFSEGGMSLYDPAESFNLKAVGELYTIGGLGNFSQSALSKALAGKKVSVNNNISLLNESVTGSTTPKDFETMLQLVYLGATAPRVDEEAFASWKNKAKATLLNAEAQPMSAFRDSMTAAVYADPRLIGNMKAYEVDFVDYERVMEIGRERFGGAADFTFVFTGNISAEEAMPLIEQYIGSIPAGKKKEKANNKVSAFRKGIVNVDFEKPMEVPMATILFVDNGKYNPTLKNQLSYDIAAQALTITLLSEIREKEGATYSISADGSVMTYPRKEALSQIIYQMDPARTDEINAKVKAIVDEFAANGPSAENVAKAKEYLLKNHQESLRENSFWSGVLIDYLRSGIDSVTDYEKVLQSITPEDARKAFNEVRRQGNHISVIMRGVPAAK
ncbi:MAG: insulinase family protein [Bacteroidales bacterium]|nr:insulinase family protein [Bacteroidales bacterium]